ncbi:MAG: hypothetical protein V4616_01860 [Bacteroidota bacterium]
MSTQRKCPNCKTWNGDNDHCTECGYLLNYSIRLAEENKEREIEWEKKNRDRFDEYLHRFKTSRWLPVRVLYYILYSIWFTLFALVSFLIYSVAAGPG